MRAMMPNFEPTHECAEVVLRSPSSFLCERRRNNQRKDNSGLGINLVA